MEALISIKQTSTVELYKTQFEMLSNWVRGLSDSHRLNCFVGGLKEEIKIRVKMLNPYNLIAIYGLARMEEENLTIIRRSWKPSSIGFQGRTSTPTQPRAKNRPVLIQKLTPAHMKEKRYKGLCFKCDNKWGPSYRCGGPKIFFIEEVEEETEENNFMVEDLIDLGDPQEEGKEGIGISLHAIIGSPNPKTMRVEVKLSGHNFVALIDTRSTHNFIHPRVVRRVGLNVLKHKPIRVNIADSSMLWSEGSCSNIKLVIRGD